MQNILISLLAGLFGAGFMGFLQFLITRKDGKNTDMKRIKDFMEKSEKDSCRTQMLLLMSSYPDEKLELLRLAQHYFVDLKGDWYMTSLFNKYLVANSIEIPEWMEN